MLINLLICFANHSDVYILSLCKHHYDLNNNRDVEEERKLKIKQKMQELREMQKVSALDELLLVCCHLVLPTFRFWPLTFVEAL